MKITNFVKESLSDYPGKISLVLFTPRCNYLCPSCHAKEILEGEGRYSYEEVLRNLTDWTDAIVFCGGEPTLQQDLISFARRLKQETGLAVKLDTNGSQFGFLEKALQENVFDYVAMDVKGPPQLYSQLSGRHIDLRDDVQKGMGLVTRFPDYEFRTTVVPVFENENLRWMSVDEIKQTAEFIVRETDSKEHKYFLQKFVGRFLEEGVMVDERFTKENLQEAGLGYETPRNLLEEMKGVVGDILPRVKVR